MVRGKTQMKRIENETSRHVTFSKRKTGLLKKAFELSVLCDADVALIIFSSRGKLNEFSSSSMQDIIERYRRHIKDPPTRNEKSIEFNTQKLNEVVAAMTKKIEQLDIAKRKLLGECFGPCSIEELRQVEQQLERSVTKIRARKNQVFQEQIEKLQEEERVLIAENERLQEKHCEKQSEAVNNIRINPPENNYYVPIINTENRRQLRRDTEIFIGPPEMHCYLPLKI